MELLWILFCLERLINFSDLDVANISDRNVKVENEAFRVQIKSNIGLHIFLSIDVATLSSQHVCPSKILPLKTKINAFGNGNIVSYREI